MGFETFFQSIHLPVKFEYVYYDGDLRFLSIRPQVMTDDG